MKVLNKSLFLLAILFVGLLYVLPMQIPEVKGEETSSTTGSIVDTLDWSQFWQKFNSYAAWDLEWYNGSSWISVKADLQIVRDYPQEDTCKMTLIFDASQTGNYRLTFGVDARVRKHVTKLSQYQYILTYDEFIATFDWSDVIGIPGLQITHGIKNVEGIDYFWFRMRKDDINQGSHLEIDPSVQVEYVYYDSNPSFQRRNVHANGYFWQFYVDEWDYDFRYESSVDGETWTNMTTIYGGGDPYEESVRATEVGIYLETNTLVHMVYSSYNDTAESGQKHTIFYRTGTLGEGSISLGTQYEVFNGNGFNAPTVTLDSNGYPWVGYNVDNAGYYVKKATTTSGSSWGSATQLFTPDACSFFYHAGVILPLDNGKIYVVWEDNHPGGASDDGAHGRLYNGATWEASQSIWYRSDLSSSHHNKMRYSVVMKSNYDIIYFHDARYHQTNGDVNNNGTWVYEYDYSGDSWSRIKQVSTGGTAGFVTINKTTDDMWFFYTHTNALSEDVGDGIYYVKYTNSSATWGDEVTVDATVTSLNHLHGFYEQRDGYLGVAYVDASWLYFTVVTENTAPTNEGVTITNMDDTNNLYAQRTTYTIDYDGHDEDGATDINYVLVNLTQATTVKASFKYLEATNAFSIIDGTSAFEIVAGSCSYTKTGNNLNLTIAFKTKWGATEEADLELKSYIIDDSSASDTDTMQTDYVDVVTNLITGTIECTDTDDPDRVDISSSVTIDFTVRYANNPSSSTASTLYPPDAEFTSVSIYDSSNNNEGTDSTIINGAGSVTFTAPATPGVDTYNLYINMVDADYTDGEETTTELIRTDGLKLTGLTPPTFLGNGQYQYQVKITYAFDDSAINSGVVRAKHANGTELTTDYTADATGWATITLTQTNSSAGTFTLHGHSEPNYGITYKHTNVTFTIYSLNLQGRDDATTNLPRALTYKIMVDSTDFGDQTSNTAALKTLYIPSQNYTVNTWWGEHLTDTRTIDLTTNSTTNIDTKIGRLDTDSYYILVSVNETSLPTLQLVGTKDWKMEGLSSTGTKELKMDSANWINYNEPKTLIINGNPYELGWLWDQTNSLFTYTLTFSSLNIEVSWEPAEQKGGSPGPGPSPITIPGLIEEIEETLENITIPGVYIIPEQKRVEIPSQYVFPIFGAVALIGLIGVLVYIYQQKKGLGNAWKMPKIFVNWKSREQKGSRKDWKDQKKKKQARW